MSDVRLQIDFLSYKSILGVKKMSRKCTVCTHPDYLEINRKLSSPGAVYSELAEQYNLGRKAVERHAAHYLERLKTNGVGDVYARAEIEKLAARIDSLQLKVTELCRQLESSDTADPVAEVRQQKKREPSLPETVSPAEQSNSALEQLIQRFREMKLDPVVS